MITTDHRIRIVADGGAELECADYLELPEGRVAYDRLLGGLNAGLQCDRIRAAGGRSFGALYDGGRTNHVCLDMPLASVAFLDASTAIASFLATAMRVWPNFIQSIP